MGEKQFEFKNIGTICWFIIEKAPKRELLSRKMAEKRICKNTHFGLKFLIIEG